MDFEADMCEEYDGDCEECPCRRDCEYSTYIKRNKKRHRRY